jgi:hypothetical protein
MKDIRRLQNLVDEVEIEYNRLQDKMLMEGLTEKEEIKYDLLEHLMDKMK